MYLMYADESGSTGIDLDNKQQPFFVLAGICVKDRDWHKVNDLFENRKIEICSDFKNLEIHASELFNSNPKSPFYKNDWKYNIQILEELVEFISTLNIQLVSVHSNKKLYKKHFGNNIIVDPYLYSFAAMYRNFNLALSEVHDYGILFCDELQKMVESLQILYPKLNLENKNVIEKTFYLDSSKNNFIQIADICAFYINKFLCIDNGYSTMDEFKNKHCLKMVNKINKIASFIQRNETIDDLDIYFK